jgi:hypothetical protein
LSIVVVVDACPSRDWIFLGFLPCSITRDAAASRTARIPNFASPQSFTMLFSTNIGLKMRL